MFSGELCRKHALSRRTVALLACLARPYMNRLEIGLSKKVFFPEGGYFFIDDEVPDIPRARIFDPNEDCFNPLARRDYRKCCSLVENFDALFSRGEDTLTKDTGLDFISDALEGEAKSLEDLVPTPDKTSSTGHIWAYGKLRRILRSPVLKRVLCSSGRQFSFNPRSVILARINRAELGEFDALALGLFLISSFKGQVVIPDFGFYGRDIHTSLVRENRLVAGVNFLDELPDKLRQSVLLMNDKMPSGATYDDAQTLARYARLLPGTNEYNDFVHAAMA